MILTSKREYVLGFTTPPQIIREPLFAHLNYFSCYFPHTTFCMKCVKIVLVFLIDNRNYKQN